jgi:succinate dehydrogenase / fumarate reductase flavoprotein subunit
MCVYLDLTHISRSELDRKLGGILDIYEKFQGVDPRETPMRIFPAVHYSMGGLWVDYRKNESTGGLVLGSPENQVTNIPGLYAIGECDYQYHGANRLGANSLLSCIFSGLVVAPSVQSWMKAQKSSAADLPAGLFEGTRKQHQDRHQALLKRSSGGENPYLIHQQLGDIMTRAATVVRRNDQLTDAIAKVQELYARARKCSLSDSGNWTNQNIVFTKSLLDMFPLALTILQGALQRDESRGAHYKPDFTFSSLSKDASAAEKQQQAEAWCDNFEQNTQKWLKSTVAQWNGETPEITYEDVDTSLIPPRPRLYGLVGGEEIDQAWKARAARRSGKPAELAAAH